MHAFSFNLRDLFCRLSYRRPPKKVATKTRADSREARPRGCAIRAKERTFGSSTSPNGDTEQYGLLSVRTVDSIVDRIGIVLENADFKILGRFNHGLPVAGMKIFRVVLAVLLIASLAHSASPATRVAVDDASTGRSLSSVFAAVFTWVEAAVEYAFNFVSGSECFVLGISAVHSLSLPQF